jgi:hypothetical protein
MMVSMFNCTPKAQSLSAANFQPACHQVLRRLLRDLAVLPQSERYGHAAGVTN